MFRIDNSGHVQQHRDRMPMKSDTATISITPLSRRPSESSRRWAWSGKSFLAGIAFAVFVSGCAQKIDTPSEFLELAWQHERSGRLPEAVTAYRKAIDLDPKSSVPWYDLGVAYATMEQFPDAIDCYTKAIELDPGMSRAYNNRAAAYARLKQFDRAIGDCDIAVQLDPEDPVARRNRGLAYHDNGQLGEAIADYDESIRINGRLAETYHYRGNVYLDQKNWSKAADDFDQAIRLDERLSAAWLSRAIALAHLGRREEAEQSRDQAQTLGADTANVNLDVYDPGVAPVAQNNDLQFSAAEFVREQLKAERGNLKAAAQPWDLQSEADENVRFVVRVLAKDDSRSNITFSSNELDQLQNSKDVQTTLIVVSVSTEAEDGSRKLAFQVVQVQDKWNPDRKEMQPVRWSLPIQVSKDVATSDDYTGETTVVNVPADN